MVLRGKEVEPHASFDQQYSHVAILLTELPSVAHLLFIIPDFSMEEQHEKLSDGELFSSSFLLRHVP